MSVYETQLRELVAAVSFEDRDRARVAGATGEVRDVTVANERGPFLGLADALYAGHYNAYLANDARPSDDDGAAFLAELGRANRIAQRVGLDGSVQPRDGVTMPMGHFVVFGRPIVNAQTGRQIRFYWNIAPSGAATFVREITGRLDAMRIPFQAKVPAHPLVYARTDAGVLYLADEDLEAAREALLETYLAVRTEMRDPVPLFTLRLAPGLSFAESPPTGDSFGMHRCDLIAEGMVQAFERGAHELDDRLEVVRQRLIAYGFDLKRFAFNPTAHYPYRFPAFEAAA